MSETLRRGFEISAVKCGGGERENQVVEESCKKGRKGKRASTTSLYIGRSEDTGESQRNRLQTRDVADSVRRQ